jgi:hypothetical protein
MIRNWIVILSSVAAVYDRRSNPRDARYLEPTDDATVIPRRSRQALYSVRQKSWNRSSPFLMMSMLVA